MSDTTPRRRDTQALRNARKRGATVRIKRPGDDTPEPSPQTVTASPGAIQHVTSWAVNRVDGGFGTDTITMYSGTTPVGYIPLDGEKLEELRKTLVLLTTSDEEFEEQTADGWRITNPEDPEVPKVLILEHNTRPLAYFPLEEESIEPLAKALGSVAPAPKERGLRAWAERNPKKAWAAGILSFIIIAAATYTAVVNGLA